MELTLAPAIIGLISSVVTELLKYIKVLNSNELTRAATAIIVIIGAIFATYGATITSWQNFLIIFGQSIVYALTSYKAIIQPIATTSNLKTQE